MGLGKNTGNKTKKSMPGLGGRGFVGVDVSDNSIKMVQISGKGLGQIKVDAYAVTQLPTSTVQEGKVVNVDQLVASLQQLSGRMPGLSKNVVTCMPANLATVQNFSYDPQSGMDLEAAAEMEAAQISAIDDIHFDYFELGDGSKIGVEDVMLVVVKKEDTDPRLVAFEDASLEPVYLDLEIAARTNAYIQWISTQSPDLQHSVLAVFDIGENQTQAEVVCNGKILFTQRSATGGSALTREIQRQKQMTMDEAENLKKSGDVFHDFQDCIQTFNAQIAQDIQRTLQFFYSLSTTGTSQKVERILITGGGSSVAGLSEVVTENTGIPAQILNPCEFVNLAGKVDATQFRQDAARLTVAFGLALRGLA